MGKTKDEIQEEVLNILLPVKRGGAGVSMGVGKTRLCLKHMDLINKRVTTAGARPIKALVVAPKKKVFDTWKEEAVTINMESLIDNVTFSTYRSLPKQSLDYDVIYLDECHNLLYNHNTYLKNYTGRIIGLTGTPPKREKSEKGKMVAEYCPILYTYETDDAIGDDILNDYKITVHLLPLGKENDYHVKIKDKLGNIKKQWWTSEVKNYDYWTRALEDAVTPQQRQRVSIMRMSSMKKFPTKEKYAGKLLEQSNTKTILFANTQEQADVLCKHSYHSKNSNAEANFKAFNEGTITKLSCVFQLSEGINMIGLETGIILHAYGNNRKFSQRLGRLLRLSVGKTAEIHVLCFKDTVDVKWVTEALSDYDQTKIDWYDPTIF